MIRKPNLLLYTHTMVTQVKFLTSNPGYDNASRYVPNGKGARVSNTTSTHAVKFGRVLKASKLSDMFQATHAPGAKLGMFFFILGYGSPYRSIRGFYWGQWTKV